MSGAGGRLERPHFRFFSLFDVDKHSVTMVLKTDIKILYAKQELYDFIVQSQAPTPVLRHTSTFVTILLLSPIQTGQLLLFDLILYVPSTIFQVYRDGSSWVEPVLS